MVETTSQTQTEQTPDDEAVSPPRSRWNRFLGRWHYTYVGLAAALVLFCMSLTPSLLPRGQLLQGLIGGISAAIGYGLGVLAVWLVQAFTTRRLPSAGRVAWWALAAAAVVFIPVFLFLGSQWQKDIHQAMGMDIPSQWTYPVVLLIAVLLGAGLVGLFRLLRKAARGLGRLLGRWIPARTAKVIAATVVILLAFGVLNGVVIDSFFSAMDSSFKTVNAETNLDSPPPDDVFRSGGPGSLVSWASLGKQGRVFVTNAPTVAELESFGGSGAQRPVRVYTGLDTAPTSKERAELAVRELERTGGFARKVLCVITTTGTGWVDEPAVQPLEYMYNGDSALVAMQYSYLPSWLSFLVDKERAREAGRDLFDAVYGVWSKLPVERRPKLLAFGESLGSFGAESPFSGADDISNRVDGMLLVGPPNRNELWREYVANRDPDSPEILPVYQQGETVRFAGDPTTDLSHPSGTWDRPRVVYLQHPSDPIVWWAPRLMVSRPDWLEEPRGKDVMPGMRWLPFVTFWQVTADMAFSTGVPAGHGHSYGTEPVAAWAEIAPPDGWTTSRNPDLVKILEKE
jgi:uncharacterized membrane protein